MRKTKTEVPEVKLARKRPDFSGVKGELVTLDGMDGLQFSARKAHVSPYDALLEQLAAAPKNTALKFGQVKARASVTIRARKKGFKVSFAELGGALYVRFDGRLDDDIKAARRQKIQLLLRQGVAMNSIKLAARLLAAGDAAVDAQLVEAICVQMMRAGEIIRQEGDLWANNPRAKGAAA